MGYTAAARCSSEHCNRVAEPSVTLLGQKRPRRRVSRDRANLRISRDRANLDLEMVSHQMKIRVQTNSDDSASLSDSLPPGPPSSSTGESVAEHEVTRSGAADNGVAPTSPAPWGEQIIPRATVRVLPSAFPGWPGTARRAAPPKKRPAPAEHSPPPPKKKAFNTPYYLFRLEQQPLKPPGLSTQDREKRLGELSP